MEKIIPNLPLSTYTDTSDGTESKYVYNINCRKTMCSVGHVGLFYALTQESRVTTGSPKCDINNIFLLKNKAHFSYIHTSIFYADSSFPTRRFYHPK